MKSNQERNIILIIFLFVVGLFFYPFFLKGLLPIPADTIVGLYHPFRDLFASTNPNGIPFKNFLITDPVRQLYPWKELVIHLISSFKLPVWNPYEMAGKPLLANFQSGVFYPLNLLLLVLPFYFSWSLFIILQVVLAGFFFYLYADNLGFAKRATLLGMISFSFSGFVIAWLEWGNVVSTLLWLPLILFSIDKIIEHLNTNAKLKIKNLLLLNLILKDKKLIFFELIFVLSLIFSFFAGHLQTFIYVAIFSFIYLLFRAFQNKKNIKVLLTFSILSLIFVFVTAVQWIPTLQFIFFSARGIDQSYNSPGWFMPLQNLIQFVIPDFFGNPSTLNYWGTWNYAEFVGYIGFIPLLFAVFAVCIRRDRNVKFFLLTILVGLFLIIKNPVSILPYSSHFPFFSTAQPTRMLSIITFSLSMLSVLGFDYFLSDKKDLYKNFLFVFIPFVVFFVLIWWYVMIGHKFFWQVSAINIEVTKHNLVLPTALFLSSFVLLFFYIKLSIKIFQKIIITILIGVTVIDLLRFGMKFESFSNKKYLYPNTKTIEFLQKDKSVYRIASTDSRILPPNFSTHYHIQSIEGYDPLYLLNYGEYIAASERGKPDIHEPFGYNRIITPHNTSSQLFDLLNTKYVLSLSDINQPGYKKVFEEGQTKVYENLNAFPRVFFVSHVLVSSNDNDIVNNMFDHNLHSYAIIKTNTLRSQTVNSGSAQIKSYTEDKVVITTQNSHDGFLVFSDVYYPTWSAYIDGGKTPIFQTDLTLRGVFVPKGNHTVIFQDSLF